MKRVKLTDEVFNELDKICTRMKMNWFYQDYYKRKTISIEDVQCIYDAYTDVEDIMFNGEELPQCLKELFQQCNLENNEC